MPARYHHDQRRTGDDDPDQSRSPLLRVTSTDEEPISRAQVTAEDAEYLVNRFGEPLVGQAEVTITHLDLDPTTDDLKTLPSSLEAHDNDNDDALLLSLGMVGVSVRQDEQPLRLAPDTTVTLEFPVPDELVDALDLGDQIRLVPRPRSR